MEEKTMSIKVTPPFTEADKKSIIEFCRDVFVSRRRIDTAYTGFTEDEALALILPGTGFDADQASFILAHARGDLPDSETGENGETVDILY